MNDGVRSFWELDDDWLERNAIGSFKLFDGLASRRLGSFFGGGPGGGGGGAAADVEAALFCANDLRWRVATAEGEDSSNFLAFVPVSAGLVASDSRGEMAAR